MHQNIVKFEEFNVSWLQGSQCIFAAAREGFRGFRSVSAFFSSLREARVSTRASGWVLDLRAAQKVPEELWNWVVNSWYPQLVDEGLSRQAIILPLDPDAREQWQSLNIDNLTQKRYDNPSRAIQWLGEVPPGALESVTSGPVLTANVAMAAA